MKSKRNIENALNFIDVCEEKQSLSDLSKIYNEHPSKFVFCLKVEELIKLNLISSSPLSNVLLLSTAILPKILFPV